MTQLLEKAFSEAAKLPAEEQDALANWLLEEIESERQWRTAFDNSLDILEQLADEALKEHRAGKTKERDP